MVSLLVKYLPSSVQKSITYEAPGTEPFDVSIVAPTIVTRGKPFPLKIVVRDYKGFPSLLMKKKLYIELDGTREQAIELGFSEDMTAIALIEDLTIRNAGFYRYACELNGKRFYSNPVKCTDKHECNIYWGDPHIHTAIGDCHPDTCRTLAFCYKAGKYISGLDFLAVTDHVSNGRCSEGKWKEEVTACELHNETGCFVTIPAYEASFKGGSGGDNNVYFTDPLKIYVDGYDDGTVKDLCGKLAEHASDFFVVPHHTTRAGKHGEIPDEIYPGAENMPVIEIHSTWGTSEYRGNATPLKIHPGPGYAVDLLNRGLRLGFIGGSDSHRSMTFPLDIDASLDSDNQPPGLTAVFSENLSREALFNGIKSRNCYATILERIYLCVDINGVRQGQILRCEDEKVDVDISIAAAAQTEITTIEIIKNGAVVFSTAVGNWKADVEFSDTIRNPDDCLKSVHTGEFLYYYVRVSCESGARAWSSPIWFLFSRG